MAVDHMHKCGVVHRDLNPRNVFILNDENGCINEIGNCEIKVIDFNVSKKIDCQNSLVTDFS